MREFKLRASKGSVLLQSGKIGAGTKTYVQEWLISELTGKTKRIDSKYLKSGIEREPASLARASKFFGVELTKNETQLENDFFTGCYDAKTDDMVIDVKSSWSPFTLPLFENEPDKGYVRQLQIYMDLTGLEKASLVYCLENGTEEMIESLSWRIAKEEGAEEPDISHWEQAEKELNYDHLPEDMRIKVYSFERDDELISNMKQAVLDCRSYIENELLTEIKQVKLWK